MNEDKPRFKPVSVEDTTDYDAMNGAVRAKRVNYVTADGTRSYVVVPTDKYTVEEVTRRLEEAATNHEQVMSIRGNREHTMKTDNNPFG